MAQSVPPDSGLAPEGINSTTSVGKVNDAADKTVSQNAGGYDPELADRAVRLDRLLKDKRFWSSLHTLLALVSAAALDTLVRERFLRPEIRAMLHSSESLPELIDLLERAPRTHFDKWQDRVEAPPA